jgi:hypothetical protein
MAQTPDSGGGGSSSNPGPTSSGPISHQQSVWAVIIAGLVMVALADYAPHLVIGILGLILAGVVVNHSSAISGWLGNISTGFSSHA